MKTRLFLLALIAAACGEATPGPADVWTCLPAQCPARAGEPYGFHIGTNHFSRGDFESFTEALPDAEVFAVLGPQYAWMLVGAAATDAYACCGERVDIEVTVVAEATGKELTSVRVEDHAFPEVEGGIRYLSDMLLVLGISSDWRDQRAIMTMRLEPTGGGEVLEKRVAFTIRAAEATRTPSGP